MRCLTGIIDQAKFPAVINLVQNGLNHFSEQVITCIIDWRYHRQLRKAPCSFVKLLFKLGNITFAEPVDLHPALVRRKRRRQGAVADLDRSRHPALLNSGD